MKTYKCTPIKIGNKEELCVLSELERDLSVLISNFYTFVNEYKKIHKDYVKILNSLQYVPKMKEREKPRYHNLNQGELYKLFLNGIL